MFPLYTTFSGIKETIELLSHSSCFFCRSTAKITWPSRISSFTLMRHITPYVLSNEVVQGYEYNPCFVIGWFLKISLENSNFFRPKATGKGLLFEFSNVEHFRKEKQAAGKALKYKYEDILNLLFRYVSEKEDLTNVPQIGDEDFDFDADWQDISMQETKPRVKCDKYRRTVHWRRNKPNRSFYTTSYFCLLFSIQ